jgi:tetratricopeptide (TPR) repeat protein
MPALSASDTAVDSGHPWRKATAERTRNMKRTSELAAAVITLGMLAPFAAAQDKTRTTDTPAPPTTESQPAASSPAPADDPLAWDLFLKSGRVLSLRVVDVQDDKVVVTSREFPDGQATLPFSELSDYTAYELLASRMDQRSPQQHERLGDWAMDRKLYPFAVEQYGAAVDFADGKPSDDLLRKLDDAEHQCGSAALDRGRALMNEGRLAEARSTYADIARYEVECPAADEARRRLAEIDASLHEARVRNLDATRAGDRAQALWDRLESATRLRDDGDRMRNQALLDAGSIGQVKVDLQEALDTFNRALRAADTAQARSDSTAHQEEIDQLRSSLRERISDTYVELGHNSIVRGSYVQANEYMGLALATDPGNPRALALRDAIDESAGSGGTVLKIRPNARMRIRNFLRNRRRG